MKTIHKFLLEITDDQDIKMPEYAGILKVDHQHGDKLCVWAVVDTDHQMVDVSFKIIGTGHPINSDLRMWHYLDSVQMIVHGSPLVWHVFVDSADKVDIW